MKVYVKDPGSDWREEETDNPVALCGGKVYRDTVQVGVALLWPKGDRTRNRVFYGHWRHGRMVAVGSYRGEFNDIPFRSPEELLEDERKYRRRMRELRRLLEIYG
jgi:hypothetical protein